MLPQQPHEPSFSPAPPQVLLDDLTLVIDVALLVAFATAVHLLRQKLITVVTLAHALSVAFLVFTVGHYVERHVIGVDGVDDLVSRRGPGRGGRGRWWLASWSTAGLLSIGAAMALVARFWSCKGNGRNCTVGDADPLHNQCKMMRLRFFSPVFSATVVFVYLCISSRLNALLGGSVLHPRGGGYALAVLVSPALLSTICLSGCASVWLYAVLVEAQASGDIDPYRPETNGGAFGAASRAKRTRRAKTHAGDPAWEAPYSNRGEKVDHARRRWPPNQRNYELNRVDKQSSSPSPRSLLDAGDSESDFEASSSSFLFGGGQRVVGGGVAGFGVVGRAASLPSSSSISSKRWHLQRRQQQQQQQQQRDLDGATVAWDSGPQGGFRGVGGSGGGFTVLSGSPLGGRESRHTSDAASQNALPLRPNSESGSVFGGRSDTGKAFRRERGAVTAASVSRGSAVVDPAPTLGPPFLPLPGGVETGGSRLGDAGGGRAVKRPLLPQTVGSANGWTSSSSSSASASSSSVRVRRRRGERRNASLGSSDASTRSRGTSSDDNTGVGGLSRAKLVPSSFRNLEGKEEGTRRALTHRSGSSNSSTTSSGSSSRTSREEEEEWSVVGSGRWGRPAENSPPAGIKPALGVHAIGWGGGGDVGAGHAHGTGDGRHSMVYNGTGGGGTTGSLRRRPTHRA